MVMLKKIINNLNMSQIVFWCCLLVSVALSIGGFLVPPLGVIDGSVLTCIGELLGFATLSTLPMLLKKDSFEISHGNTHLKVGKNDTDE